jgi:hypothetical protein
MWVTFPWKACEVLYTHLFKANFQFKANKKIPTGQEFSSSGIEGTLLLLLLPFLI